MNKLHISCIILSAAMTVGCSQDSITNAPDNDLIKFQPNVESTSRQGMIMSGGAFYSVGFCVTATHNRNTDQNYFSDQAFTYNGRGWGPADNFYYPWPNTGTMYFNAYSPKTLKGSVEVSDGYVMKIKNYKPDVYGGTDVLAGFNIADCANHPSYVSLKLHHITSAFQAGFYCENPDVKYEVAAMKLVNIGTNSDFTSPNYALINGTVDAITPYWTTPRETDSYVTVKLSADQVSPSTLRQSTEDKTSAVIFPGQPNHMFLIPQVMSKSWTPGNSRDGVYISLLARISVKGTNDNYIQIYPAQKDKYAWIAIPMPSELMTLMPQRRYFLTVKFCSGANGGVGYIAPDQTNLDEMLDDLRFTTATPDPLKQTGDPILGGQIEYSVITHDWDDGKGDTSIDLN